MTRRESVHDTVFVLVSSTIKPKLNTRPNTSAFSVKLAYLRSDLLRMSVRVCVVSKYRFRVGS